MKLTVLLALVGAVAVAAQDTSVPADTPPCVVTCWNNMLLQITNDPIFAPLKCAANDYACACRPDQFEDKIDHFGSGMRDCSKSLCTDLHGINAGIDLANNKCGSKIAHESAVPPRNTDGAATGASGSGAPGAATPIATSSWTTVIVSGDATTTIETASTIFGTNGSPTPSAGGPAETTSPLATTATDGTVATTGSATTPADATDTGADGAGGASSSSSSGFGAQATTAPMAGFLAAAGLVVALL
ncbi:hypothetical protein QBC34DRAFT_436080 [Podospora aff. communis PSN243]|uniref:CFEM domain-containing protein n=1 Tax=Podospora aff. communis PSN243 TaxID=3040156 RepID=A0AAV9GXB9_9PEZI|nr:hypothetical protein QBC34DRAFT_436080 [Podospora aff. communis PSN243]